MDLQDFDLNLLVILRALLLEQSVSKAAQQLNLSQPATSAALSRLRMALNDPILVREGVRMVPTPRAEALTEPVQAILAEIEQTLAAPQPFDPSSVKRTFRIATNDYGSFIVVPRLMKRLQLTAPNIDLEIWPLPQKVKVALRDRAIDLALADDWALRHCQCTRNLFSETFTCLVRQDHPRIQSELTLSDYLQEKHALVSFRGRVTGTVDVVLARQDLERHVSITLPHILAVPEVIASTDLVVTIATRIANRLAADYGLNLFPPPVKINGFEIAMAWQNRMTGDRATQWLRRELIAIGQAITKG